MKLKLIIFLFFVVAVIGLVRNPNFVFSQEAGGNKEEIEELNRQIAARKDKIKELEDTIEKYKKNIEQKRVETVSLKNQLSILDNHIAKAEADLELTQEKIKEAQLEIEALQITIEEKEAVIEKQKAIIAKMVRNINADKQKSYLEILLSNSSFSEFYNQIQYAMNIYGDLGKSVKILRLAKEDLQNKQQQAESKKKTYEDLKKELENKKAAFSSQADAKQNLLIQTKSSEARYKTLLSSLKQQYQAVVDEERYYEEQVRKKLAEQNKLENSVGQLAWPLPNRTITAIFHDPDYPFRNVFEHSGIDIRASQGTPVHAVAAGYIARAKICSTASCYSYVLIIHTDNISTLYGHLSSVNVIADQFVNKGDVIGYSGGTPGSIGAGPFVTGPHLHFEVRSNGIPVNPMGYL